MAASNDFVFLRELPGDSTFRPLDESCLAQNQLTSGEVLRFERKKLEVKQRRHVEIILIEEEDSVASDGVLDEQDLNFKKIEDPCSLAPSQISSYINK